MSDNAAKASRKVKKYAVLTREPRCFLGSFAFSWEQRKLSEIADKVTEKNAGLQYVETFTNSAEFGIISQRDFFDHDIAKLGSLDGYYIVKNEDFVYNPRISTSAPVGPINRNKLGRTGVMSPLYTVFRPHDIDTTYLEYFFKCGYWHSFMNFNGDSGARSDRFSIKDNVFFQMPIPIPHIDEQRKIGELLTRLDHLITLHQRKCAFLFKRFRTVISKKLVTSTLSWEQRKFFELYEKVSRKNDLTYGRNDIISVANMYFKPDSYITDDSYLLTYNIFELGDIAFEGNKSKRFLHGRFVENTIGDGIVSHVFVVFHPISAEHDINYWKYAINNENIMRNVLIRCTKSSTMMTDLVVDDFLKETILVPTYAEQQKIGAYFRNLDRQISLQTQRLEKLKQIKAACLDKMFV